MGCIAFKKDNDIFNDINTREFQDIIVIDIDGNPKKISDYLSGVKLLIIVNTASYCGYTKPNYTQLVELHNKYREKGLQILGFPCNQFYSQENKSEGDIKQFVQSNFNVEFPMFAKVDVNGKYTHELYIYLKKTHADFNMGNNQLKNIPWNFTKFLVSPLGKVYQYYSPDTEPLTFEVEIQKYLSQDAH